jgi:hypothetical protein
MNRDGDLRPLIRRNVLGCHWQAVRRRPEKGGADELYLCRGSYARELRAEGLRAAYVGRGLVGRWEGGPGSGGWNWEVVAASLRAGSLTPPARGAP